MGDFEEDNRGQKCRDQETDAGAGGADVDISVSGIPSGTFVAMDL
jgi:hypothetical protein